MGNDARNWDKVWALSRLSNCIMANIGDWAIVELFEGGFSRRAGADYRRSTSSRHQLVKRGGFHTRPSDPLFR
jgi:hypothetical protein